MVDGIVLVQKLMKKSVTMVMVRDLSECFYDRLVNLTQNFDEVILVFDTYKRNSLKKHNQGEVTPWEGPSPVLSQK